MSENISISSNYGSPAQGLACSGTNAIIPTTYVPSPGGGVVKIFNRLF